MMPVEEGALWGGLLKSLVVCPTTSKFVNKDDERTMYFSVFLAVDNTVFEKIATKKQGSDFTRGEPKYEHFNYSLYFIFFQVYRVL